MPLKNLSTAEGDFNSVPPRYASSTIPPQALCLSCHLLSRCCCCCFNFISISSLCFSTQKFYSIYPQQQEEKDKQRFSGKENAEEKVKYFSGKKNAEKKDKQRFSGKINNKEKVERFIGKIKEKVERFNCEKNDEEKEQRFSGEKNTEEKVKEEEEKEYQSVSGCS